MVQRNNCTKKEKRKKEKKKEKEKKNPLALNYVMSLLEK